MVETSAMQVNQSLEFCPETVFTEKLQPRSHISDLETRLSDLTMPENIGTEMYFYRSGRRSKNVKYLAVAGRQFVCEEQFNNVCRLQWGMVIGDLVRINNVLNVSKKTTYRTFFKNCVQACHNCCGFKKGKWVATSNFDFSFHFVK